MTGIEPDFHCDYGFNIHTHGLAVINYNCVILDTSPVNIGAGAFILNVEEEMDFSMGKTVKGMGLHYQLSADYLLNKHVGIGVNAGIIYGNVYDEDGVIPGSMDQSVEFYRICINGGLHYYF